MQSVFEQHTSCTAPLVMMPLSVARTPALLPVHLRLLVTSPCNRAACGVQSKQSPLSTNLPQLLMTSAMLPEGCGVQVEHAAAGEQDIDLITHATACPTLLRLPVPTPSGLQAAAGGSASALTRAPPALARPQPSASRWAPAATGAPQPRQPSCPRQLPWLHWAPRLWLLALPGQQPTPSSCQASCSCIQSTSTGWDWRDPPPQLLLRLRQVSCTDGARPVLVKQVLCSLLL